MFLFIDDVPCPAKNQTMVGNDIGMQIENIGSWEECGEYLCTFHRKRYPRKIARIEIKIEFSSKGMQIAYVCSTFMNELCSFS